MDALKFKVKYGFEMPSKKNDMIISCRSGKRGFIAKNQLKELGYNNIQVFDNSSQDWKNKGKRYW